MRVFDKSSAGNARLGKNPAHQFALQHSWKIFECNAVYTMIPKNGCSSFRYSIGLANGVIEGPSQLNWIHANNGSFSCDTQSAFNADYTFVILRCPYRRVISAFYNKIVDMDIQSWQLFNVTNRKVHPHDISFNEFLGLIKNINPSRMNNHWKPQCEYILYKEYDDVFCVEKFDEIVPVLKDKINFDLIDTRPLLAHDRALRTREVLDDPAAAELSALELLQNKKKGRIFSNESFLTDENIEIIAKIYAADIALYKAAGFGALLQVD